MDIKHQEETDAKAEKYLKSIKKLHDQYIVHHCGQRPNEITPAYIAYKSEIERCKMRVEIINTEANQLNLPLLAKVYNEFEPPYHRI